MRTRSPLHRLTLAVLFGWAAGFMAGPAMGAPAAAKRVVFLAGNLSHPALSHEYVAGCLLLQRCLAGVPGVTTAVYLGGWPKVIRDGKTVDDDSALEDADAIVVYSDGACYASGAPRHPLLQGDHLKVMGRLMHRRQGINFRVALRSTFAFSSSSVIVEATPSAGTSACPPSTAGLPR